MENVELQSAAESALSESYQPFTLIFVLGRLFLPKEGKIFVGTNIENASFGLSMCAERVAIFKAVSEGYKSFTDLAVISSAGKPAFPCGACRQVLAEFNKDIKIHLSDNYTKTLSDLLPDSFNSSQTKYEKRLNVFLEDQSKGFGCEGHCSIKILIIISVLRVRITFDLYPYLIHLG